MAKYKIEADFRGLFRPLSEDEYKHAKAANEADPNHERIPPVVLWKYEKIVVDGHHTLKIRENMRINGKPPKIRFAELEFESRDEALAYAIRAQLGRRNLHPSQIAIALAKLPKAKPGRPRAAEENTGQLAGISREALAEEHGIGERTLRRADAVHEHGAKVVQDAVAAGDVSVSDAAAIVDLPKSEQAAALRKVKSGKATTLKDSAIKKKTRPKVGKVSFDYKNFESVFGKLVRLIDDHHRVHPDPTMRDACHESLNTMLADFNAWRRKAKA